MKLDFGIRFWLAVCLIGYFVIMAVMSWLAEKKIKNVEDYVVAGRRLPLHLSMLSLLATWFGAESMLTACGEIQQEGMRKAALDPLGSGLCLLIAGVLVASRLWNMNLTTVSDFFARRYGSRTEVLSACILVPSYFGWIAAQIIALALLEERLFGWPLWWGILFSGLMGGGLALFGGMWSVTMNDGLQMGICLAGLAVLAWQVLAQFGGLAVGPNALWNSVPDGHRILIPLAEVAALTAWADALCIGALGNLPGQDLLQRIFAAKSAQVARRACVLAGLAYLAFGSLTVLIGLGGWSLVRNAQPPVDSEQVMTYLAEKLLTPPLFIIFILALVSAVVSTIESAILSPAVVLGQNVLPKLLPLERLKITPLRLNRITVALVTLGSIGMAYSGQSAYELVRDAYAVTLVALFVPLLGGLYFRAPSQAAALAAMLGGAAIWGAHYSVGAEQLFPTLGRYTAWCPVSIGCTLASLVLYVAATLVWPNRGEGISAQQV